MRLRTAPRTACAMLLLAAMAYGLGAARCGCWEHSGWRAAIALASGEAPGHSGDGDRVEHVCEALPDSPAALPERQSLESPVDGAAVSVAPGAIKSADPPVTRPPRRATALPQLSRPVRAELQVFRL